MRLASLALLGIPPIFLGCLASSDTAPVVDLGYAKYSGSTTSAGVTQFLGMRYAAPPLGNLRFRAPQDPLKENQTQDATSHGPVCLSVPQKYSVLQTTSEDCLFIDVQAPAWANSSSKLPVMIWFQGGAYILNLNADYNATGLIQASSDNVIVVTFNYRVGLFGFLASQDVKDDGDLNAGLLDQRKAITWVHKHISAFGGDPERVTLFGTSAGAGAVLLHTLAYGGGEGENTSKPLFSAALSADPFVPEIFPYQQLEFQYQEILNATNCSSLECLRNLPTDGLLAANINRPFPGQIASPLFYFGPCVDGIFFPDLPSKLLAEGRFQRVPLLQGTVTDEGTIFAMTANNTDVDQFNEFLTAQFPDLDTTGIDAQYSYIPLNTTTSQAYYNRASFAYGDVSYTCYGLSFAAAFAAADLPVYSWRYNVIDPVNTEVGIGVFHTWEVGAVWGPGNAVNIAAPPGADSYTNINKGIVAVVQAYWTSFARAHDPNVWRLEGSPEWKTWGPGQRLKIQTNSTAMEMVDRQQIENCEFWAARTSQVYH